MDEFLNALQWPAMVVTLTAAWLVAYQSSRKRTVRGVRKNDPAT